jgi:hypothetical protein
VWIISQYIIPLFTKFIKHQTTKKACYFIFHSMVCQDMVWKSGKLQSHKIEGLCLMLNCTSPCTNILTLSQFHWIFSFNELNHHDRAQININSDNNTTQCLQFGLQTIISWETTCPLFWRYSNLVITKLTNSICIS